MAANVQFYHLTATSVERALPKLLEKALDTNHRVLVIESAPERLDYFNQMLWTYHPGSFLPHGTIKDGDPEQQPVLLVTAAENVNHADIALVTDGALLSDNAAFARVIDLFDGNSKEAVEKARERWAAYQKTGHNLTYLRQNETGGWEEKAVA